MKFLLTLILALSLFPLTLHAQQPDEFAIHLANSQRTNVFQTKPLLEPPTGILWKSKRLFVYQRYQTAEVVGGPVPMTVDLPTNETWTMPVIGSGIVYATYSGYNAYFFALDALTGEQLLTLKFANNELSRVVAHGHIAFFGSSGGQVYAFDVHKQKPKWIFKDEEAWFSTSPSLDETRVYFYGGRKGLYAIDINTGELKWFFKSSAYLSGPAITGNQLIVVSEKGRLISLDRTTGAVQWEARISDSALQPAVMDEQIFVALENGEIQSYSLADGALKWKKKMDGGASSALVLFGQTVYYAGKYKDIIGLDAATSEEKFRFKTKRPCNRVLIAGAMLYFTCDDNQLYAVDPATAQPRWILKNKARIPAPVIWNGILYGLGTDGHLVALK